MTCAQGLLRLLWGGGGGGGGGAEVGVLRDWFLERTLQWIVCLFNLNELPFCHLFNAANGKTDGPATFVAEIGNQIQKNVLQLHLVTF